MKKTGVFITSIIITVILTCMYGILHDQVTYTISYEYYTLYKYPQFGFEVTSVKGDRQMVFVIGFLASWKMGLLIGVILGAVGFIFDKHYRMRSAIAIGFWLVFFVAFVFAIAGFLWGKYHLVNAGTDWPMPDGLINKNDYIVATSVHKFSYIGGYTGIAFAIIYMVRRKLRYNKQAIDQDTVA